MRGLRKEGGSLRKTLAGRLQRSWCYARPLHVALGLRSEGPQPVLQSFPRPHHTLTAEIRTLEFQACVCHALLNALPFHTHIAPRASASLKCSHQQPTPPLTTCEMWACARFGNIIALPADCVGLMPGPTTWHISSMYPQT